MSKATVEEILKIIEKEKLVKDFNALDQAKPLSEQGIDSLDFSGVLFNVEEVFGIEIPDADIDELQTIDDIVVYVNEKQDK
jgi:acyl carrier protein